MYTRLKPFTELVAGASAPAESDNPSRLTKTGFTCRNAGNLPGDGSLTCPWDVQNPDLDRE